MNSTDAANSTWPACVRVQHAVHEQLAASAAWRRLRTSLTFTAGAGPGLAHQAVLDRVHTADIALTNARRTALRSCPQNEAGPCSFSASTTDLTGACLPRLTLVDVTKPSITSLHEAHLTSPELTTRGGSAYSHCVCERRGRDLRLIVTGEVDLSTAPALESRALTTMRPADHVTADLSHVTFMDSSGLLALVAIQKEAESNDGQFDILISTPQLLRLFQASGLLGHFTITLALPTTTPLVPRQARR